MTNPKSCVRCGWVPAGNIVYQDYHDKEWGGGRGKLVPRNSRARVKGEFLFELLCLEGQQAGLSWWTVLQKREAYRRAFHAFVPSSIAAMQTEVCVPRLMQQQTSSSADRVIAHRGKLEAIVRNARAYLCLTSCLVGDTDNNGHDRERASRAFADYLWQFSYRPLALPSLVVGEGDGIPTFHPSAHLITSVKRRGGQVEESMKSITVPTRSQASELMSRALKKAGFAFVGATTCHAFMQACGMVNDHAAQCRDAAPCETWRRQVHQRDVKALARTLTDAQLLSLAEQAGKTMKQKASTSSTGQKRARRSRSEPATTKKRRVAHR